MQILKNFVILSAQSQASSTTFFIFIVNFKHFIIINIFEVFIFNDRLKKINIRISNSL